MNKFKKTIAGVLGFAIALSLVVVATSASAKADTISDLQAQIATLTQQLSALSGSATVTTNTPVFTKSLTIGSRGTDVTALQTWLISKGFTISAGATGYFGSQTQAAVAAYQTSKGITPAAGYFGPITIASVNAVVVGTGSSTTVSTVAGCAAGAMFSSTTGAACSTVTTLPAGCSSTAGFSSTTGASCTTGSPVSASNGTPGVAGTLAVSLWTTPSGVTAYKGQSYDIAGYKLQAGASDMTVTNLSFDFDTRFWLYANAITVKDELGNVVGQVNNLSASNFSELTVGSDYRISVPVSGFVVKATQSKYLTLNASFLGVTDRASGNLNVIEAQVRSVDGTGITDTETVGNSSNDPTVNAGLRTFAFEGSNVGQLVVTNDPSSPTAQTIQVSTAAQTQNVVLAIYDIKSQNEPGTLQSLTLGLSVSSTTGSGVGTLPIGSIFSNIQIKVGGLTYSASSLASSSASFTNLQIPLAADVYTPVTISATLAQDTNGVYDNTYVTTSLAPSTGITAIDATYNNIPTGTGAPLVSLAQTFSSSGVTFGSLTYNPSTPVTNNTGSTTDQFTFSYSLTAGNNPIYVSSTYSQAVSATTTSSGSTNMSTAVSNISFRDSDSTNDGTGYFYVAPGQTKTFTVTNAVTGAPGTVKGTYSINALHYGIGTGTASYAQTLNASAIANSLYATIIF